MNGWLQMPILSTKEGIDNPRPEFLEAHENGNNGIAHVVLKDKKESVCGKAIFYTGKYKYNGEYAGLRTLNQKVGKEHWINSSEICKPCKEFYDSNKELFQDVMV